jgi:hypothetical protein
VQHYIYFCRAYIKDDQLPSTVVVVGIVLVVVAAVGAWVPAKGDCRLGTPSTWNFGRKSKLKKRKKYNKY